MPRRSFNAKRPKRSRTEDTQDRGSDPDIEIESSSKRAKKTDYVRNKDLQTDDLGNEYWELSQYRRVGISEFKGKTLVNIREFYPAGEKMFPGKKGISLSREQFEALVEVLPALQKKLGETKEVNGDRISKEEDDEADEKEGDVGQNDTKQEADD